MQSVRSRIWTRIAVFISYGDNDYTTGTSDKGVAPSPTLGVVAIEKVDMQSNQTYILVSSNRISREVFEKKKFVIIREILNRWVTFNLDQITLCSVLITWGTVR